MKKIIEKIKKNVLIKRTSTIVFMLILALLFIGLTLWVNKLNITPIDLTSEKLYTLTETSKERIKDIQEDVNIYFVGYSEENATVDLAKQYNSTNNKINIEVVDSVSRPDLVEKYGIDTNSTGIIVENGKKSKILSSSDLYTYDMTTYEEIDITEEKITNAILYVIAEKIPTVYFLEDYSEFSLSKNMNYLSTYLGNEVTQSKTLNILTAGNIPEDCDTLVITSPSKDFDDIATNAITDYINKGGNILWFNLVVTEKQDMPNVNKILKLYGVNPFEVGVISETDNSRMMSGAHNVIIPSTNYSTITKNIPAALFVNASKINFVTSEELENLNVTKTNLLETSEGSFFRTNLNITSQNKQEGEEEGPFVVGAELQKKISEANSETGESEKISKLVIYGENIFITDYTLSQSSSYPMISYSYNKDLVMDSIAYLVDRQEDIVIRKDTNTINYTATVEQDNIIQGIIFGVPVLIIFAGIIVWQHRRRKK